MFECEQCGGKGYITYVSFYMGSKVNDNRPCECLKRFTKEATPKDILEHIKHRTSNKSIQKCPF